MFIAPLCSQKRSHAADNMAIGPLLPHVDRNLLGVDWWIMGYVIMITHQELQGMFAGRQLYHRFCLTGSKMQEITV